MHDIPDPSIAVLVITCFAFAFVAFAFAGISGFFSRNLTAEEIREVADSILGPLTVRRMTADEIRDALHPVDPNSCGVGFDGFAIQTGSVVQAVMVAERHPKDFRIVAFLCGDGLNRREALDTLLLRFEAELFGHRLRIRWEFPGHDYDVLTGIHERGGNVRWREQEPTALGFINHTPGPAFVTDDSPNEQIAARARQVKLDRLREKNA